MTIQPLVIRTIVRIEPKRSWRSINGESSEMETIRAFSIRLLGAAAGRQERDCCSMFEEKVRLTLSMLLIHLSTRLLSLTVVLIVTEQPMPMLTISRAPPSYSD